jgi:hypothetical protein
VRVGRGGQLADGHGTEAQVHRQVGHALHRREIARFLVTVDPPQKILEQARSARHAGGQAQLAQIGGGKPHVG